MISYYNYCKVNPGRSYGEFLDEDAAVIDTLLTLEELISEKTNSEVESKKKSRR